MKEAFVLRKSPTRTEAFLAANRRNAQKCTGPRTPEGKARVSLNGLKNGRYAHRLLEKLEAAGYHSAAALYGQVRSEMAVAFNLEDDPVGGKQVERVAAQVWCLAWRTGVLRLKPQSPLFRKDSRRLPRARLLFRIKDPKLRIGMVYWVQRKRYWTAKRLIQDILNGVPSPVPTVAQALESKLRKRVYRLGQPDFMEQIRYGLDRDGFRDPAPPNPDLKGALKGLFEKLFGRRWWEGKN